MPSVSVPEKTLEHWSSQYVTFRYRSKAAQWWPASGEDISLGWLPGRPGKVVQLELKTTTVTGAGLHRVMVDVGQLWEYRQLPMGHQPFYAFPWPDWHGSLADAATSGGRPVTELGFARSGPGWWFADWMVLITAADVAQVLAGELKAHGRRDRGTRRQLVRFDLSSSGVSWGSGGQDPPSVIRWRDFWPELERCGRAGWPQLFRVPARTALTRRHPRLHPQDIIQMIEEAGMPASGDLDDTSQLVTLEPGEDGNYQIADDRTSDLGRSQESATGDSQAGRIGTSRAGEPDNRQLIFLDAQALRRADS